MPVPKKLQTCFPSVDGEGEAELLRHSDALAEALPAREGEAEAEALGEGEGEGEDPAEGDAREAVGDWLEEPLDDAAPLPERLPEGDTVAMAEPHSLSRSMSPPSTSQSRVTLTAAIAAAPKPLVFAAAGAGMVGVGAVALVIVLLGVIGWMSRDEPVAEAPVAEAPAVAPAGAVDKVGAGTVGRP
jgi:hypothetical protein